MARGEEETNRRFSRRGKEMKKLMAMVLAGMMMFVASGVALAGEGNRNPRRQGRAPAAPEPWYSPKNITGNVAFTTNYMFRGVSQTNDNPAIQGGLDYVHPLGFYLGVWGSNVDLGIGTSVEIDYKGGYAQTFGDFKIDVGALYYSYPGWNDVPKNPGYFETHLGVFYTMPVQWPVVPTMGVGWNWSPSFFYDDGTGNYVNGLLDFALPWNFGLGGEIGYQYVQGDTFSGNGNGQDGGNGYDYMYYRASIYNNIPGWFKLDLSYMNTSGTKGFFGDLTGPKVVFTVSRTF